MSYQDGLFYIRRADTIRENGDFVRAIEFYTKAVKLLSFYSVDPYTNSRALFGRAFSYREIGEHEKAILDCDAALRLNPNNEWGWAMRGASYADIGNYEKAVEDITIALELNPNYNWAYMCRGYAYAQKWQLDKALLDFYRVNKLDPNDEWTQGWLDKIDNYKIRFSEGVEWFTKLVNANPNNSLTIKDAGNMNVTYGLFGHESKIWVLDISSDGSLAVSGGEDGKIILWNI